MKLKVTLEFDDSEYTTRILENVEIYQAPTGPGEFRQALQDIFDALRWLFQNGSVELLDCEVVDEAEAA